MKKENQIKKRKILNELIQEIVNEQVEMMLLENTSGALYTVFIQPFVDTANVIKGELKKSVVKTVGAATEGLVRAFQVLLPFTKKVPFSGKTWDGAIKTIQGKTKGIVNNINKEYATSYDAVAKSFQNPDLAFTAFAFNPGLYLGTALATNSFGGALSAASSMLGTSGEISNNYNNLLKRIGIFSPAFTPSGQGVSIDVGMGGSGDGYGDGGGLEETVTQKRMKNLVSFLIEDIRITNKLFENITQTGQPGRQLTEQDKKIIYNVYSMIMNTIGEQWSSYRDNRNVRNEVYKNLIKSYQQSPANINSIAEQIKSIKGTDIVTKEQLANINQMPEAQKIIDANVKFLADELRKSFKDSTTTVPKTLPEFIKFIKTNQDPKIQQAAAAQLKIIKDNFSNNTEISEEERKKIESAATLETLYNNLPEADKKSAEAQYVTANAAMIDDNKNMPKRIADQIRSQFEGQLDEITLKKIVDAITAPQS